MARAKAEPKAPSLTPDDIERYFTLKEEIVKKAAEELAALEKRFKTELDEGEYPAKNGFLVKRWNQIGNLKDAEAFAAEHPVETWPDLYTPTFVGNLDDFLPSIEDRPDLYEDKLMVASVKEVLPDDDKKVYFSYSPYLKVTKVG